MIRPIQASALSLVFLALMVAVAGCSGDDGKGGPPSAPDSGTPGGNDAGHPDAGPAGVPGPEQACLDVDSAISGAAARCGFSEQEIQQIHDAFLSGLHGSCANVVQIRDESSLRSECIRSFQTMSCDTFDSGVWDPSCKGQLLIPETGSAVPGAGSTDIMSHDAPLRWSMKSFSSTR